MEGENLTVKIPPIKLPPKMIIDALDLIERYGTDPLMMREHLLRFYRESSTRNRSPSEKTIMRAVIFPTLRHLDLIEGVWPDIHLNPNGMQVVLAQRHHGSSAAKRRLRLVVQRLDQKIGILAVLRALSKSSGATSRTVLAKRLARSSAISSEKEKQVLIDRLDKWVNLLSYLEFVEPHDNTLSIRLLVENIQEREPSFDTGQFEKILVEEYKQMTSRQPGLFHVPIPLLRDKVSKRMPNMMKDDFYELLKKVKNRKSNHEIYLSQPMHRSEGGLVIDDKYYYFIGIREREG
jgi:hypothetical protein